MTDFLQRIAKLPADRLALLAAELKQRLDRAEQQLARRREPIAIVGMGCRFPGGGDDPERYWTLLRDGVDAVREVPAERWDAAKLCDPDPDALGRMITCRGGFLERVDEFDARFFGIAPREAVSVDPQHRLLLEVTWEALEHAGIAGDRLENAAGGIFIGLCGREYFELMLERPLTSIDSYYASGAASSMAAGRIAYLLGLSGPAFTVDTACSSSLVALHLACESLRNGECRFAIAGGANLIVGIETMIALTRAHMLSPDGRCSTFDERANGIVRGEGCGIVVLKSLADALADGDRIHAVIRATAINQDGRSSGITAPNGTAQEALMRLTLERAGLAPGDVDYIEAHGTGTRLGDPIEVRALGAVYGDREPSRPLRIGSVKTNFGHLEGAAGVAGLLKLVLALSAREIPPHLHLQRRNPLIEWERWPFEIPTTLTPWVSGAADGRRRGAVSSFGFSGTNAHAILEEPPPRETPVADAGLAQILPLSARSETALRRLARSYADTLASERAGDSTFTEICVTAATGRARFPHRSCVIAKAREEAAAALDALAAGRVAPDVISGRAGKVRDPVFLFTGQGAQYVDMGRELYVDHPVFRAAFERCDEGLRDELEVPLREIVYPSSAGRAQAESLINQTAYAQPALFAIEYALAELWRAWGIEPAAVAGHSIGEFAAAVVAGVLTVEDALTLVAARARLMQALPAGGAMAAVLADAAVVEEALAQVPEVEVAAYNAPASTVISGAEPALARVLEALARRGIEAQRLAVSHAFHSALMAPMLDALEDTARRVRFSAPEIPFVSTLTGAPIDHARLGVPGYWRQQARRPVRFADALRALRADGQEAFVEVGPHAVLCGLGSATLEGGDTIFLPSLRRGQPARETMLKALAGLHVRGAEPDWQAVASAARLRKAILPTYPFERTRYWLGWSTRAYGTQSTAASAEAAAPGAGLLWARDWVPVGEGAAASADPEAVRARIADRAPALVATHGGDIYEYFLPRLDALCGAYVMRTLRALGAELTSGALIDETALREQAGVLPAHARLFRRMFEMLAEDGVLAEEARGLWRVVVRSATGLDEPGLLLDALLAEFPACRIETEMTARCGDRLAEVLTGRANVMELLFPGGSLEQTERLYAETPSFRVFNTLVAEAVAAAAEWQAQTGRAPRILEIGAGTGGTTSRLLPLLSGITVQEYVFTDVSPLFLERARAKLGETDFLDYRLLDIARDPRAQGFDGARFDIVVASNVLHATPDLSKTLAHVRELLAPGGLLVLLEGVRPQRFGDLTVGMTEGWWCFTDTALRPGYALLDRDRWFDLLARCGFERTMSVPDAHAGDRGLLAQQAVMIARVPDRVTAVATPKVIPAVNGKPWLALVRAGGVSAQLAAALRHAGVDLHVLDVADPEFDADAPAAYAQALEATLRDAAVAGVVHLLSLDECARETDTAAEAMSRQQRSAGTALRLAQAVVRLGEPELVYVTRAVQAIKQEAVDPTGAPLWGLRRTIASEHPALKCLCIDLPAEWAAAVPTLAGWLGRDAVPPEDELAIRGTVSYAARIVPHAVAAARGALRFDPDGAYIVTGGLAGLGLRVAEWLAQHGAGGLVLCGRSAPSAETVVTLERMRAAGVDVRVVHGDVADPDCVAALVEAAGTARLRGVFHSAGVTFDATLPQQNWSHWQRVMNAKVAGTWNLHRATRDLPGVAHFVLFSTGAAFFGTSGQANHAGANAFLGALGAQRRAAGLPGLTIDWGAWSEIGAATRGDVIERARAMGFGALDPDTGLALLEQAMTRGDTHVAAIAIDWETYFARHAGFAGRGLFSRVSAPLQTDRHATETVAAVSKPGTLAAAVMAAKRGNRRTVLFDGLHAEASRALGLAPQELIDPGVPLTELGLDSLMAVELRNALGARLDRTLPATLIFTYPTLEALTEHLASELGLDTLAADRDRGQAERNGRAVEDTRALDALDEEALEALLERKLGVSEAPEP